jgi:hypothetical protein
MDALETHLQRQIEQSRTFFWHRLRWRVVSAYLPRGRPFRLLDIGAGAGLLGEFLARDFSEATYLFVEPIASLERHLEVRHGTDRNAKEFDSFHDVEVVTLLDVLEHQRDDREFLGSIAAKMDPGALLLITVPARMWLWSGWDVALGHYRRYEAVSLARCWEGLPFEVRELSYLFPELVPPAWARKILRRPARASEADEAAFPSLPRPVNEALYRLGVASLRRRRRWRTGTSLLAALRRA